MSPPLSPLSTHSFSLPPSFSFNLSLPLSFIPTLHVCTHTQIYARWLISLYLLSSLFSPLSLCTTRLWLFLALTYGGTSSVQLQHMLITTINWATAAGAAAAAAAPAPPASYFTACDFSSCPAVASFPHRTDTSVLHKACFNDLSLEKCGK